MFSRGINDAWVLKSQTGKELGNYGPAVELKNDGS
jgi:hypothetical protein